MDVSQFTIGRPVRIKTDDDIYDSYISAITLSDENFVYFKSGSLRITLLDKLKSENSENGNKLDVTGGTIKGNLTVNKQIYMGENKVLSFVVSDEKNGYLTDENGNKYYPEQEDTKWQVATLTSGFRAYNNADINTPRYRKIGNIVEIVGCVSPVSAQEAGWSDNIFTLPEGFRPSNYRYLPCQGSGVNKWLLTVNSNGAVSFSRYGAETTVAIPQTAWLPFNIVFLVD